MVRPGTGRSTSSGFIVPSQDEWIKAAYFDPDGGGAYSYWQFPTGPSSPRTPRTADERRADMSEFTVNGVVKAQPEVTFDVYLDHRNYVNLVKIVRSAELEKEGDPAPNGLGAVRKLRLPGATVREEVTEYDRPSRYSYKVLSGGPFDKFEATVTFTPVDEGTAVAYNVSVEGSVKALPVKFPSEQAIRLFMKDAAAEAERVS